MPTISIDLTDEQVAVLQAASVVVHQKPIKKAVMGFLRFTVREYRTRGAAPAIDQQVIADGFPPEEEEM